MSKNTFQLTDEEVRIVYLAVQTLAQHGINNGDLNYAIKTDELRTSLRNNVVRNSVFKNTQETQEYYEDNARFIASGKWDK